MAGMYLVSDAEFTFEITRTLNFKLFVLAVLLGVAIALAGVISFRKESTTVNPLKPETASSLVTSGIFQYTRNPMYLGMAVAILGFAILLGSWLSLLGVVAFVLFIERFQIKPEEAALIECFGEQFIQYKKHIRRWL
ncbi:isoprenylcysteine carboxylmethyltransferase family protein [Pseudoalteromonas sp. MMG024]|uniref:methyltransferase family protein n=1 Tax=Pseudoalteromonas sp. MMG024 TaxID=2909980 RepID=UPI001F1AC2D2|nr:isoprenylcysteine carboxylmethyltransferase family protein [Pseudoalteromonas sp. MMG024]MCF6457801.1 isoprenylcysteine carboxylmethyltransferase family protein [Pseudoalteromonas sp. MMG024]